MSEDLALVSWTLAAVVLACVLGALAVAARRVAIHRRGGTVECGLRLAADAQWRPGIAGYRPGQLCWFPAFGITLRPDAVFDRHALRLVARQSAESAAVLGLGPGTVVAEFETGGDAEPLWLAMSADALTGFLAWLEATPPHRVPGPG